MQVEYSKSALKFLSKLDKKSVQRIRSAIEALPNGDIKPLQGFSDGRMRLRVGVWRVIYRIENSNVIEVIFVIDIGNRGDVYK